MKRPLAHNVSPVEKRGAAMLERNQVEVELRADRVKSVVDSLKGSFKNLTALSEYVAERVSEMEKKNCNASSLRRNPAYRVHLNNYMAKDSKAVKAKDRSLTLQLQLQLRESKIERDAIEKQLSDAYEKIALLEEHLEGTFHEKLDKDIEKKIVDDKAYPIINKIISLVDSIKVDTVSGQVIDEMTMLPVFTKDQLPGYFEWYEELEDES